MSAFKRAFQIPSAAEGAGQAPPQGPLLTRWQPQHGRVLATAAPGTPVVQLYSKSGRRLDAFAVDGHEVRDMAWAPDGSLLAVVTGSASLFLWDGTTKDAKPPVRHDAGLKAPTALAWRSPELLAIGTAKGALTLWSRDAREAATFVGKARGAIVGMQWTTDGALCLASKDRLTVCDAQGETIATYTVRGTPSPRLLAYAYKGTAYLAAVVDGTTLVVTPVQPASDGDAAAAAPKAMAFDASYGDIVSVVSISDTTAVVGFATGWIVAISLRPKTLGQMTLELKVFSTSLASMACQGGLLSIVGDDAVRIYAVTELRNVQEMIRLGADAMDLAHEISWNPAIQQIVVSTTDGRLISYVCQATGRAVASASALFGHVAPDGAATVWRCRPTTSAASSEPAVVAKCRLPQLAETLALSLNATALVALHADGFHLCPFDNAAAAPVVPEPRAAACRPGTELLTSPFYAAWKAVDGTVLARRLDAAEAAEREAATSKRGSARRPAPAPTVFSSADLGLDGAVVAFALNDHVLVLAYDTNAVVCIVTATWRVVTQIKVKRTVVRCTLREHGSDVLLVDAAGRVYVWCIQTALAAPPVVPGESPSRPAQRILKVPFTPPDAATPTTPTTPPAAPEVLPLWNTDDDLPSPTFAVVAAQHVSVFAVVEPLFEAMQCVPVAQTRLDGGASANSVSLVFHQMTLAGVHAVSGKTHVVTLPPRAASYEQLTAACPEPQGQVELIVREYQRGLLKRYLSFPLPSLVWAQIAEAVLLHLDVTQAIAIYRNQLHDAGMVLFLETLEDLEDLDLIRGHVAASLGRHDVAQEAFLQSSQPIAALTMRCHLLDYDVALRLAHHIAEDQIGPISLAFGRQLETEGKWSAAMEMYQSAVAINVPPSSMAAATLSVLPLATSVPATRARSKESLSGLLPTPALRYDAQAGVARMALRLGDTQRGIHAIAQLDPAGQDATLRAEAAKILLELQCFNDAGAMYLTCHRSAQAIQAFALGRNWAQVGLLMDAAGDAASGVDPMVVRQYALALEQQGRYSEAAATYERAHDIVAAVRVNVVHLRRIDHAMALVRTSRSKEAAMLIARHFREIRNERAAVEFFYVAGMERESLALAKQADLLRFLGELVAHDVSTQPDAASPAVIALLVQIADHFRHAGGDVLLAGNLYKVAAQYANAVEMFLLAAKRAVVAASVDPYASQEGSMSAGGSEARNEAIALAIDTVGLAHDATLTRHLIDYLVQASENGTVYPRHLLRLYLSLNRAAEAAKSCVHVALASIGHGELREARETLLDVVRRLNPCAQKAAPRATAVGGMASAAPPSPTTTAAAAAAAHLHEPARLLYHLHSYMLVRQLVRANDHHHAALNLLRLSRHLAPFAPRQRVAVLTSCVLECMRRGWQTDACQTAGTLMRPENRDLIDPQYRRKIEQLVRRPPRREPGPDGTRDDAPLPSAQTDEAATPCPFCEAPLKTMALDCTHCQNHVPMCVASGCHITLSRAAGRAGVRQCPSCYFLMNAEAFRQLAQAPASQPDSRAASATAPRSGVGSESGPTSPADACIACPMCAVSMPPQDYGHLLEKDIKEVLLAIA
ncbi:hypothetical protein CXG81DRAFT_20957 [Caulochytrium protostelioides]|uniref:Anaphase-promoting complex subunit 4 WD40 domain-containing protein n=1 Tax=Caulochytrium protostelioides TaxID=1555241 RepID=A0A4P9WZD9_9FUNG|nr:hypothetical protein CXG81DRAFT_20957 [Caulochytrium protostelioides]|eukprot:RKO98891.1 hypothetical protein CXG81DRAFT_20957 [Caulochytrium protostelioides]